MAAILVIAAHPDDEVLGAGGTLARRSAAGDEVHVCILCDVTTSRPGVHDENTLAPTRSEAERASRILGVAELHRLGYADNRLDELPRLEIIHRLEEIARRIKPEAIYTHHPGDLNIDHRIAFDVASVLARPAPGSSVRELSAFYVPSSTDWAPPTAERLFRPNLYVDIAEHLQTKIEALEAYASEECPWPHARSIKAVEHLCRLWGAQVGCEAAEAFWLARRLER